ncbi:cytochrome c-type biogenesis protein CcmH [Rhizobiales bacterium GAS113]|nr:cytochrome c-type biogenesis protein CcmH [Rhizobiales bacterium GAS113]
MALGSAARLRQPARQGAQPRALALIAMVLLAVLAGIAMGPRAAHAVEAGEMLADPKLEARARALSGEFRCLVCQNESIDESNAQLAHDLRILIREQLAAGRSDGQVRDFLVARYGQFVLLKPRFDGETLLLWLGPFLVLAAGAVLVGFAARRRSSAADAPLSEAERVELERLQAK